MSSRRSYWTGASVPMTGERGLGPRLTDLRVEQPRRETSCLDVAQDRTRRIRRGDRRLPAEPCERERALRVDLGDPRRLHHAALRKVPEPVGGGSGVQAVDEADGVGHPGLLDKQALEQVDSRIELLVDRGHDAVDRCALLNDLADLDDHLIQAGRDLPKREDHGHEVEHERDDDQ
jgi:hypothetical protein